MKRLTDTEVIAINNIQADSIFASMLPERVQCVFLEHFNINSAQCVHYFDFERWRNDVINNGFIPLHDNSEMFEIAFASRNNIGHSELFQTLKQAQEVFDALPDVAKNRHEYDQENSSVRMVKTPSFMPKQIWAESEEYKIIATNENGSRWCVSIFSKNNVCHSHVAFNANEVEIRKYLRTEINRYHL